MGTIFAKLPILDTIYFRTRGTLYSSGRISLSEGTEDAGMSIDELKEVMSKAGYKVPEMA